MKRIILNIIVIALKIIYMPFKLLKIQDKIVYISRQSNKETLDFKLIKRSMESMYPNTQTVILTKKIEHGLINKIKYSMHMIVQMYHIATSKAVILDSYCIIASILKHKKETKIIQIWHAISAVKKFGYQSIDTEAGSDKVTAKIMCMHKNYDFVLAPSKITAKHFQEGFGIDEKQIVYIGMPRIDYILNKDKQKEDEIYKKYPILKEKRNILYVPTFRKGKKIKLDELIEKIDTKKFNLIVKLHPLDIEAYQYKKKDGIIYENGFETYDLLKITDKVITDYSSLAMEAALLNIPVYFYTYDIEEYKKAPGLNFSFEEEEIGKYQAIDVEDLLDKIKEDYDFNILQRFKEKYISVEKENCSERLVRFIVENLIK